jgi:predicted unusual protein kinase regulating ubiquinone biosynthesis (AarF/ABC1/UbiB family)
MSDQRPTTSAVGRFLKLGGLMGRVGTSVLTERTLDLALSAPSKQIRRTENLVKNAVRIVETLGEMKGAAMKVGQMLSLHEGLLPPEAAEVLRALQKEAPRVPSEVMVYEVEGSLGGKVEELFENFETEAYAAASIGQVHRGRLEGGQPVAIKVQYPLIDQIVKADLKNLKTLLRALLALISDVDFEPIWREVHDRLLEELDYTHEAENMRRMAELHAEIPEILIPGVIDERSTERVLTMEFLEGISPEEACSDRFPAGLRNRWARVLFEFQLRGLLEHRFLHADPNLANFSFLEDGRVIVYDFGCVKRIPKKLAAGYSALFLAAIEDRYHDIPDILLDIGVFKEGGTPLPQEITDPYVELFAEILRQSPPYLFGEDEDLYDKLFDLGVANWSQAVDIRFPEDIVFIDRSLSGHFGNLTRLRAAGPWRELVQRYVESCLAQAASTEA